MEGLLQDVIKDQQEAAPVLLQEDCSRKEDKPGAVRAHSTGRGAAPQIPNMVGMGTVSGPINSPMVIRQGKVMSHARVHPDDCSGTSRDRAGWSLYASRQHVSPWGCSGLCKAVGACRTRTDESNVIYGLVL